MLKDKVKCNYSVDKLLKILYINATILSSDFVIPVRTFLVHKTPKDAK